MEKSPQKESNKNPKKKIIISLSILVAVILVVVIAGILVDPPLFKGLLSPDISSITKTLEPDTIVKTETLPQTDSITSPLDTELKDQPVILETVTKSEEPETLEIELMPKELEVATPPELSFAYLDRYDSNSSSIYGNVTTNQYQPVMIFRLRNSGTMSAYLKSFNTFHSFNNIGCAGIGGHCYHLASRNGRLARLNYDKDGNYLNWTYIGQDSGDGNFTASELTNKNLLEINGKSDTYFAIITDTRDYLYFGDYDSIQAQAFIELNTFETVDSNDKDTGGMVIDPTTITPGVMIYK